MAPLQFRGRNGVSKHGTTLISVWNLRVELAMPFSIINRGEGWFWCSLLEARRDAMIGPFPSQEEAEKDAKATLGIEERSGRAG
jgi:hypothetical protein